MPSISLPVECYDLGATLDSGQAFRWVQRDGGWEGILGERWVRLSERPGNILAQTVSDPGDWEWLRHYLQTKLDLSAVLATFPDDEPMRKATTACAGLRLLRQDPWECLASFILSSTKQIVQLKQIVQILCERFGRSLPVPAGHPPHFSCPSASFIACRTEKELRDCKMGFRAPYLLETARLVECGTVDLRALHTLPLDQARQALVALPGVGRKIADCVLLFAYGFQQAFPVDVWVLKALRHLYFPRRAPSLKRLRHFSETHFGPYAGYAQQYLFHYMRTKHLIE
jgi:N-glycosylase/DNA lyase